MNKRVFLIATFLFYLLHNTLAQPYTLHVEIKNHPFNNVVVGKIEGDKFIPSDTVETRNIMAARGPQKIASYTFPPDACSGMYRIIFGQTKYAKVMDEPPQQLDFIFNMENIRFETDFKSPADSLKIIASDENQVWFSFLNQENQYRQKLKDLEAEVNFYQDRLAELASGADNEEVAVMEGKAAAVANSFNLLQMERESFVSRYTGVGEKLFAGRIIKTFHEPFRDGYLSIAERNLSWQKNYFRYIDFSDGALINTSFLADKIFSYLVTYNRKDFNHEQREQAYIKAVDAVMQKIESDAGRGGPVYEFVLNYLIDGFEGLKMSGVLEWIADNYGESVCKPEEKTTLRRKLEAQKMKVGNVVPDFTMNDLTGRPVVFSEVLKKRNLLLFWASWCPHCNTMLPVIKRICAGKDDLEVVAVALDKSGDEWHKAVYSAGFEKFKNLSDLLEWDGPVAGDYNVYATPTMFVVDGNRKIIAKPSTPEELSKALESY